MEANTFQRKLLSFILFTLFLNVLIASPVKANNSSSISTNSTKNVASPVKANNSSSISISTNSTQNVASPVKANNSSSILPVKANNSSSIFISTNSTQNVASPVKANNSSSISTNSTENLQAHIFAHVPLKHSRTEKFKTFVMTHCKTTISPALCYDYLSPYAYTIEADLKNLCNISIIMALNTTRTASSTVINGQKSNNLTNRAAGLLQLCANNVNGAIGKLQKSVDIMAHVNATNTRIEVAKVKALVDESATATGYCYGQHTYDPKKVDEALAWVVYEDVFYASAMNTFSLTFINELLRA